MIICYVNNEIDPAKTEAFEECSRMWMHVVEILWSNLSKMLPEASQLVWGL